MVVAAAVGPVAGKGTTQKNANIENPRLYSMILGFAREVVDSNIILSTLLYNTVSAICFSIVFSLVLIALDKTANTQNASDILRN